MYDAPRETLQARAAGGRARRAEADAAIAGCAAAPAAGGCSWRSAPGKRINVERTEELLATGADAIAVACPFCMTMIGDGVKAAQSEVPVLDIAELVAGRI